MGGDRGERILRVRGGGQASLCEGKKTRKNAEEGKDDSRLLGGGLP